MAVNLRKFMQLIVFFAHNEAVKPLGKTKLFKLLYFTDVTYWHKEGQLITGAEYLKYPYGPVPVQGDFALKELQNNRLIRMQRIQLPNERFMRDITALQAPDMTIFTDKERITTSEVIQQYGNDSAAVLSWKSHQEPAWLFAEDWRPLQLAPEKRNTEPDEKIATALALMDEWYATPDDKPPGYWDEFLEEIEANRFHLRDEDFEL